MKMILYSSHKAAVVVRNNEVETGKSTFFQRHEEFTPDGFRFGNAETEYFAFSIFSDTYGT
jgi:hypothetical protein